MVCTRTLYHEAWAGNLPIGIMELPEAIKRKHTQTSKPCENKKNYGKALILGPKSHLSVQKRGIGKVIL